MPGILSRWCASSTSTSGIEAARRIREHRDTPIIFITAHGDPATRATIEKVAPGSPVLAKPISADRLREAITTVMKKAA